MHETLSKNAFGGLFRVDRVEEDKSKWNMVQMVLTMGYL